MEPAAHLPEQSVAGRVPEAVVDHLEAVQVAEEDGDPGPGMPRRGGQGQLQVVDEQGPVGQPGQGVMGGGVLEARAQLERDG
ncbi:MAG TPA: hypothetical protein VG477_03880, partial [Thermoanaerobaculia bacterium]|nr:hypothetical protein [Thermoanaerobaculia bacterium]